jgi:hypothetical protein
LLPQTGLSEGDFVPAQRFDAPQSPIDLETAALLTLALSDEDDLARPAYAAVIVQIPELFSEATLDLANTIMANTAAGTINTPAPTNRRPESAEMRSLRHLSGWLANRRDKLTTFA